MMLKIHLWGDPDDVAAAALRMRELFNVLSESQDEPDRIRGRVRRYLDVSLETKQGQDSLSLIQGWEAPRLRIRAVYSLVSALTI